MSDRMLPPKINRNVSVLNNSTGGYHSLTENGGDASPLKLFSRAKQAINSIYQEFYSFIGEVNTFLDSSELKKLAEFKLVTDKDVVYMKTYQEKCDGLIKMISRDRMKVVFFGRTSNGKSTVINAMLREKILPTGIGHTTNCFLQVEGCDSNDDFCIYTPGNDQPQNIANLNHLSSALSEDKLDCNSLVRVIWPKEKCRLLKEDVLFVDSPGIDVSSDLDSWIDQQCLDADVFVLVVNAESTLTKTEKDFFNKVSERLSKPNVFILNNRWDATAYELERVEEVKAQHIQRNTEFLCNELKVCTPQEVSKRIYFVSAREVLFTRTQTNPQLPPGYQSRQLQFEWFEAEFEKCISMSAVKTKFDQPSQRGKAMTAALREILESSFDRTREKKTQFEDELQTLIAKIELIERRLQDFTQEMKDRIRFVMEDVEKNVALTLNDEIKKIYNLIDQYERPFHPEEHQLNWYKKELHKFVEQKLGLNLSSRLNTALLQNLELTQKEIRNKVLELVESEESRKMVNTTLPRTDFVINYRLDCSNLCSDFREDISFHFSLGFTALMRRFTGNKSFNGSTSRFFMNAPGAAFFNQQSVNGDQQKYYDKTYSSDSAASGSNLNAFAPQPPQSQSLSQATNILVVLQGLQMIANQSNIILIAVGGIVWRGLGWKILAITGSLYGLCYLYERLMWTRKTQEKLFKKQYADYASTKLRLIVDLTSQNAACQVQQELSMYFAQMCRYIDITKDEFFQEMRKYENDIKSLNILLNQLKIQKNKGKYLNDNFDNFIKEYIESHSD